MTPLTRNDHKPSRGMLCRELVTQISNLWYGRLPVGRLLGLVRRPAGWKSAIQQIGNLRYALRPLSLRNLPGLKRFLIAIAGSTLLAVGVAMIILPGPAIVVIPAALAILAIEFVWARRWLAWLRERFKTLRASARSGN